MNAFQFATGQFILIDVRTFVRFEQVDGATEERKTANSVTLFEAHLPGLAPSIRRNGTACSGCRRCGCSSRWRWGLSSVFISIARSLVPYFASKV
jgi:hypothetical protein